MRRVRARRAADILGAMVLLAASSLAAQSVSRPSELQALSPSFWNLLPKGAPVDRVATGFGFTEGPVWDARGFLWVSDETLNQLFQVDPSTGKKQQILALGDPDGNTYDRKQRLLDCASVLRAIIRLSPDGKQYSIVADHYQGKKLNSPNDVVLGPDGAIYFTDPTSDLPKGARQEIPFEGVYRISPSGDVRLLTRQLHQPNGLAFSPDGRKLYIDEDEHRSIWVFDFDRSHGTVGAGRLFGVEPSTVENEVPDGMKVDTVGNLYVVGPRGIWVWSPEGRHLGTIVLPEQPANLAWGDPDYRTLYMTAETSVYRVRTKAKGFIPYLQPAANGSH